MSTIPATTPTTAPTSAPSSAPTSPSLTALLTAVTTLLDEGADPASLTVADVSRRAGLSRPTFYKHARDVPVLVRQAALQRMQATFDQIPPVSLGQSWEDFAHGTFRTILTDLATRRRFYLAALRLNPAEIASDFVHYISHRLLDFSPLGPVIRRRTGPDTPVQRAEFLAAGAVWLVQQWLAKTQDPLGEVEDMVGRLTALLLAGSGATEAERTDGGLH